MKSETHFENGYIDTWLIGKHQSTIQSFRPNQPITQSINQTFR
ncbi:MAG TPA: hypothetical protein VLB50_12805 [Ignavibacteriaceae bacterium]|nr:hypothetical protein [Ignavibacteriaceae bacterium]